MTGPRPDDFVVVGLLRCRSIGEPWASTQYKLRKRAMFGSQRSKEQHRLGCELLDGGVRIGMSQPQLVGLCTGIREPVGLGIPEELQPVDERWQFVPIKLQGFLQARGITVAEPRLQTLLRIISSCNEG